MNDQESICRECEKHQVLPDWMNLSFQAPDNKGSITVTDVITTRLDEELPGWREASFGLDKQIAKEQFPRGNSNATRCRYILSVLISNHTAFWAQLRDEGHTFST